MTDKTFATEEDLFARLNALGVAYETVRHAPFFTVEEGKAFKADLPGGHTKNLFVKDKAGALFLVTALADTTVDLKALSKRVAKGRVSFGKPELLLEVLGVTPGSVTPFAVMNDTDNAVRVILDAALMDMSPIYAHPLHNAASTAISPDGLLAFLKDCGKEPAIMGLTAEHLNAD